MADTPVKFPPVDDSPDQATVDPTSDAGKVQLNTRKWAREVTLALRNASVAIPESSAAVTTTTGVASPGSPGAPGAPGSAGSNGWSPVFALVPGSMGVGIVVQITGWTGGDGDAPASPVYIGPTGFTTDITVAVNIQGPSGGASSFQYGTATLGSGVTSKAITFPVPFPLAPAIVDGSVMPPDNNGAVIPAVADQSSITTIGATLLFMGPTPDANHILTWKAYQ